MRKPKAARMTVRIPLPALLFLAAAIPTCAQPQNTSIQMGSITVETSGGAVFLGGMPASQPTPEAAPVDPSKAATISGTVLSAATGEPLRRARVTLQTTDQKMPPRGALTDESGHFSIAGISPGKYDVSVEHTGYVRQEYGQDKPGKAPEMLTLGAAQKIDDLKFHLQQAAVITGHVYDEAGDPVQGANVEVMRMAYVRGKRQLAGEQSGSTDDQGEYRIFGLNPGHYYVRASHGGNGFMGSPIDGDVAYPPLFYPNAISADQSSPIDLKAGDEMPGVDFRLEPSNSKGYDITGRVIGGTTAKTSGGGTLGPMSMVMIAEKNADSDSNSDFFGLGARQVMANPADGTFKFPNVTPGTYTLRAMVNENGQMKAATQDVVVGAGNVSNITLAVAPGVDISGHVTFEGNASGAGQTGVYLSSTATGPFGGGSFAQVQPDGSFTLKNVMSGTYKLQLNSMCETCYLKSASSRGANLLGNSFDVESGVAPAAIEMVYSGNTAEASGTVNGDDDKPAGGAMVIAVPVADTPNRDQRYKTSTTDQYGHYDLQGLAPGNYDVIALTDFADEDQGYIDPAFMQPYANKAERLSVKENDHQTLQLTAQAANADSR